MYILTLKLFSFLSRKSPTKRHMFLQAAQYIFVTYAIWPHARHYVSLESNTFNFLWVMSKKHLFSRHFSHVVWLKESGSVARSRHFCPLLLCYFATYYNYLGLLHWARIEYLWIYVKSLNLTLKPKNIYRIVVSGFEAHVGFWSLQIAYEGNFLPSSWFSNK